MPMQFSAQEIIETIRMVQMENLDIRTITLGISLRDCAHPDLTVVAQKVYDKICRRGEPAGAGGRGDRARLRHADHQQAHLGDADRAGGRERRGRRLRGRGARDGSRRDRSRASTSSAASRRSCTRARRPATRRCCASIPEALATTERVCASVNVGTTRAGINMDAVAQLGDDHPRHGGAAPPTATASAAPSWSCSATRWTTTRSWPAPFTASASPSASSTSA